MSSIIEQIRHELDEIGTPVCNCGWRAERVEELLKDITTDYLARIGAKGGKAKGKQNALKYHTEEERKAARTQQQRAYRARLKEKKDESRKID